MTIAAEVISEKQKKLKSHTTILKKRNNTNLLYLL